MTADNLLLEYVQNEGKLRVDREKFTIHGVKFLGERSKNAPPNDHDYPRATREKAIPLIEGRAAYLNHPGPEHKPGRPRNYQERIGVPRNVAETGDGLYGDFQVNPEHPYAKAILWDAENCPDFGFSIRGEGDKVRQPGKRVLVESITSLESVDLVTRPATTSGLFEEYSTVAEKTKKSLKEVIKALKARPEPVKWQKITNKLQEALDTGMVPPETMMAEPDEETDADDAIEAGFREAWCRIFDDDGMDMKAKLSKAKDVLTAMDKLLGKDDEEEEDDEPPTPAAEESHHRRGKSSRRLEESFDLRIKARDLCADAGIVPTKTLRKALDACRSEKEMSELIEEHKTAATPAKTPSLLPGPRSAPPSYAGRANGGTLQESQDSTTPANGGKGAATAPTAVNEKLEDRVKRLRSIR